MDLVLRGDKELFKVFRTLPLALQHSVEQSANMVRAKPLIEKAKLLAPEGPTGNLVDSIGAVRVPLKRADDIGEILVGPRVRGKYRGQHAHLVEFGTRERKIKGKGKYRAGTSRGIMPKKPFMGPALALTKHLVLRNASNEIAKKLLTRMKRELGTLR